MPRRRRTKPLAVQAAEMAFAVPQVIAHRSARTADRREMRMMGLEKMAAFAESWNAMAFEAFRANQRLALSAMHGAWLPWYGAASGILAAGIAPVHRRAVANARRLRRRRRS